MKFAVTGKGGTGKTTIAGILAHLFARDGYHVFAVDADPDANLASAIGTPEDDADSITPISNLRLVRDIGIEFFGIIGNKVQDKTQENWIRNQFPQDLMLGIVSYREIIREADQSQRPLIEFLDDSMSRESGLNYRILTSANKSLEGCGASSRDISTNI